jgi:hypothetical protein
MQSQNISKIKYLTQPGHVSKNEMDTHADTCCAGANWALMDLTGNICEVTPFLESYEPGNGTGSKVQYGMDFTAS